jgi:FkbM family methyltransferase
MKTRGVLFDLDFTNPALLDRACSGQPALKAMYYGSYEPLLHLLMKRHLRPGSTFFDLGANIGYISAIAAGLVGTTGQVHSFEPVPQYFEYLERLAQDNSAYRIYPNRAAVGEHDGSGTIWVHPHMLGASTLAPSPEDQSQAAARVDVPVVSLDSYIASNHISEINMMKIDVEGFEFLALRGLEEFFRRSAARPPIFCEINPPAAKRLNYTLRDLRLYLGQFGYVACNTWGSGRIQLEGLTDITNVLFIVPK